MKKRRKTAVFMLLAAILAAGETSAFLPAFGSALPENFRITLYYVDSQWKPLCPEKNA